MGQWLSDDFEDIFNLIYCDSDLAKSHCGDDYTHKYFCVSIVPHEILLDEYEMTGI